MSNNRQYVHYDISKNKKSSYHLYYYAIVMTCVFFIGRGKYNNKM